ncbi:response regulator transcription factor [Spirosoma humi]
MTVLLADDHTIVLKGLQLQLEEILPEATVILCQTFPAVIQALSEHSVDLIVLDIVMPGSPKSQMIQLIKSLKPDILILVYSGLDEEVYAIPYITAGADGYLSKHDPYTEFNVAISVLLEGGKYVSSKVNQLMLNKLNGKSEKMVDNPIESLTKGELEVLKLIVEGKWTKEIASILQIKPTTVSTFKKKVFNKFNVTNVTDLLKKLSQFEHI